MRTLTVNIENEEDFAALNLVLDKAGYLIVLVRSIMKHLKHQYNKV